MIGYKLILGILLTIIFIWLLIRTRQSTQKGVLYYLGRVEILVGIIAGIVLIVSSLR